MEAASPDIVSIDKLCEIVIDHFGKRSTLRSYSPSNLTFDCILYESFAATFSLAGPRGTFTGSVAVGGSRSAGLFLDKTLSPNTDEASIRESLRALDDWCRLRLPEKFLDALDAAHEAKI